MTAKASRIEYFHTTVPNRLGEAYQLLSRFAAEQVNLVAFNLVPTGAGAQLVIYVDDPDRLIQACAKLGVSLVGPEHALMVQGDDELGALADIHRKLLDASVDVFSGSGVADGKGDYGYVIHVRPDEFEDAARALGI